MDAKTETRQRSRVNRELQQLPIYNDGLPISLIDDILTKHGFNATEPAIYCGREGTSNAQVGDRTYLSLTWYKMESGRYEVVTYVS
jgi:hypothetical protein